jgi:glycosyltransferase involved in cell wall biosynthesis
MAEPLGPEPLVAVVIPALNEAGKIGRVLDKLPHAALEPWAAG